MSFRKIIKGSLFSLAILSTIGGVLNNNSANAKHKTYHYKYTRRIKRGRVNHYSKRRNKSHHHKNYRIRHYNHHRQLHRRRSRKLKSNYNHKYVVGVNSYDGQLSSDPRDAATASPGGADNGVLVKLDKRVTVHGKVFYKISSNDIDDNGWIYAGDLSNRPNGRAHPINEIKFFNNIYKWDESSSNPQNKVPLSELESGHEHNPNHFGGIDMIGDGFPNYIHMNTRRQINSNVAKARQQNLRDVNIDRNVNGIPSLTEDPQLDQVAQERAQQTCKNNLMSTPNPHIDQVTGNPYDDEVAQSLGYNNLVGHMGENLAYTNNSSDGNEEDGKSAGNEANGDSFADEITGVPRLRGIVSPQETNFGHRFNIQSRNYTKFGVGVAYSKNSHTYYVAQDFL